MPPSELSRKIPGAPGQNRPELDRLSSEHIRALGGGQTDNFEEAETDGILQRLQYAVYRNLCRQTRSDLQSFSCSSPNCSPVQVIAITQPEG